MQLFSLHSVASFAAMSAASFPGTPSCAGIQCNSMLFPQLAMRRARSLRIYCPDWFLGEWIASIAAWLSVKMALVSLLQRLRSCRGIRMCDE